MRYTAAKPLYVETPLWGDEASVKPDVSVDGPAKVNTGLVTAKGEPIYRIQPPIGFGRDRDW